MIRIGIRVWEEEEEVRASHQNLFELDPLSKFIKEIFNCENNSNFH